MLFGRLHSALLFFSTLFCWPAFASLSPADSLEMRIRHAAERGAIADELGAAFQARPGGEVLLLPPNKDLRFAILIYNIDILPDRAQFSAGLAFRDGRSNQLVAFKTDNAFFYYKQGLSGPVRLQLMSDVLVKLGRAATVQFLGGHNQTWAEFDCGGLKQFGVTADARINNNVFIPVDVNYSAIPDSALTARIQLQVKSWDEMLVSISLNPFQIKGMDGYIFNISKATLDLSGDINADGMQLPDNYRDPGFDYSWEGFYLAEGRLLFPKRFSMDSIPASLTFRNLILDERGFSGSINGARILSPEKGSLAGWRFGIDRVSLSFYRNCLSKAELAGPLGLPVLPDTQYLQYHALLGFNDEYSFRVMTRDSVTFPAIKAGRVRLDPGSQVYLESIRGNITARALLHGQLSIFINGNSAEKLPAAGFGGISFQGLSVSNKAPKFSIDYLGITKNETQSQRISNFPVSIHSIEAGTENGQVRIRFGLGLNLSEKIGCNTRFAIFTRFNSERNIDRWVFVAVQLEDITLRATISNLSFNGRISIMRSDPVFGDGFSGAVSFGVKLASQEVKGSCSAIFGNVNLGRYWYFDASVSVSGSGIPIAPAVSLNGFLGGAWHRMRVLGPDEKAASSQYGQSANGRIYVPDATAGLGLRAGVFLKSTAQGAFEGNAMLEIQFNKGGGLASIALLGTVDFFNKPRMAGNQDFVQQSRTLCALPNPKQWVAQYVPKGGVAAALEMVLDFNKETYKADLGMYVNVKSATMGLAGKGNNGFAGQMNLFFAPTNWYVWIGNSQNPINVQAIIPKLLTIDASAYFMAGTTVLSAPPLPDLIRKSIGQDVVFDRNTELLSKGVGFAVGSNLRCDIGGNYSDKKLVIYASGTALAGFDMLMQQYHNSVYCKQTGEIPGVNGWFAQGRYYVGASLNLGITVEKTDIRIANMSVGAVLNGQGPNPVYAVGLAGIHVNVLFFKYNGNIRLELGKKCDLSETRYNAVPLITISEPAQGKDVSILTQPIVQFALPVYKEFQDVDQRRLRFVPDLLLMRGSLKVTGKWIISENGEQAVFQGAEPLQSFSAHVMLATLYLEAWNPSNASWQRIKQAGSEILEQKSMGFQTGGLPKDIPLNNVASAYPYPGQVNLHRDYSNKGFVTLKIPQWQSLTLPGTRIVARFSAQNGECREVLTSIQGNTAGFEIPKSLSLDKVYRFSLIRRSVTAPLLNTATGNQASHTAGKALVVNSTLSNNAVGTGSSQISDKINDVELLVYYLRTSIYSLPTEKWTSTKVVDISGNEVIKVYELQQLRGEYLQSTEMHQNLDFTFDIKRSPWFSRFVYPMLYGYYYQLPANIRSYIKWNRDTAGGLIPGSPEKFEQLGIEKVELKASHFATGKYVFDKTVIQLSYGGLETIQNDFQTLRQSLIGCSSWLDAATLEKLMAGLPKSGGIQPVSLLSKTVQAPVLANVNPNRSSPIKQVSSAIARQAAVRNAFLLALNSLVLQAFPVGSEIPVKGTYQCSRMPSFSFVVGKGGVL